MGVARRARACTRIVALTPLCSCPDRHRAA
jgi:hypothetical protein